MKQPKIKLFGQEWEVFKMEWDLETGELKCISYKQYHGWTNFVVKSDVERPIADPHQDYIHAPDLEALLVKDENENEVKKYEQIEFLPGTDIEQAVVKLLNHKEKGQFVSGKFNGIWLYSDTVTMNSAYKEITGMTKSEFDKKYGFV